MVNTQKNCDSDRRLASIGAGLVTAFWIAITT